MDGNSTKVAEVRRIHVIYFLSHVNQTEQPHLFRVHHTSRNGVFLRDIKRWLADLRGKDMPESFSWSYKRRYRTGYIWQDIVDDDLLTPISDNEYVLLGSAKLLCCSYESCSSEASPVKKQPVKGIEDDSGAGEPAFEQQSPDVQSSESSTLTEDSVKLDIQEEVEKHPETESRPALGSSFSFRLLSNNTNKKKNKKNKMDMERYSTSIHTIALSETAAAAATATAASGTFKWSSSTQSEFPKRKSCPNGASHMFRNLITCGAIDTKDAVFVMFNRPADAAASPKVQHQYQEHQQDSARKSFSGANVWNDKSAKQREYSGQKAVSAAYKPASGPSCSQCGKPFKPEKMHKHMKSCPGMKASTRKSSASTLEKELNWGSVDAPLGNRPSSSLMTYTHSQFSFK